LLDEVEIAPRAVALAIADRKKDDMMKNAMVALIGLPSWAELAIVALVLLLLFARRLPAAARAIGQTVVEFRRGLRDDNNGR